MCLSPSSAIKSGCVSIDQHIPLGLEMADFTEKVWEHVLLVIRGLV